MRPPNENPAYATATLFYSILCMRLTYTIKDSLLILLLVKWCS